MLAGPASHQVHRPKPKLRTQKTRFRHLRSHADHPQSVSGEAIADRPDHPGRFVLLQAFILQCVGLFAFMFLQYESVLVPHSMAMGRKSSCSVVCGFLGLNMEVLSTTAKDVSISSTQ